MGGGVGGEEWGGPEPHPAMPVWESEQRADSPRLNLSTWVGEGGRNPP